ncbi:MAG TPA: glycosyltransferase, partial [Saprospiraceae bacterium]|nr:glycosyltransferase [Saprospiraceae bacterium]
MVFIFLSILCATSYFILQSYYLFHWSKTPNIIVPSTYKPKTPISIIIVVRNGEKIIEACIQSIFNQQYPTELFELIIIDDRSEDETESIVKNFTNSSLRFFRLIDFPHCVHSPAFKKSGIELGVHQANNELIVVTDSDCTHHGDWLRTISYTHSQYKSVFYTGPVQLKDNNKTLVKMQQMENQALMLVTAAGMRSKLHDIANGANMAFSKQAFQEVGGYQGNYQYASGDDMFLIEKMRKRFPDKIRFIKAKTAIVWTEAKINWESLIKQRIRWSGKNKGLKNPAINWIWQF